MSSAAVLSRSHSIKGELAPLFWLTVPLLVVAWTLDSARWVDGLPPLTLQVPVAVVASYLIVSRIRQTRFAHLVGLAISVSASALVAALSLADSHLFGVGVFLLAATWITAYATVWLAYGIRTSIAQSATEVKRVRLQAIQCHRSIRLPNE